MHGPLTSARNQWNQTKKIFCFLFELLFDIKEVGSTCKDESATFEQKNKREKAVKSRDMQVKEVQKWSLFFLFICDELKSKMMWKSEVESLDDEKV